MIICLVLLTIDRPCRVGFRNRCTIQKELRSAIPAPVAGLEMDSRRSKPEAKCLLNKAEQSCVDWLTNPSAVDENNRMQHPSCSQYSPNTQQVGRRYGVLLC